MWLRVVMADIADDKLEIVRTVGAFETVRAAKTEDVKESVRGITQGSAHVSVDALGSPITCFNSSANLRKHGKFVQAGLMLADHSHPSISIDQVTANELEILGSYGIQAYKYTTLLKMIKSRKLHPEKLTGIEPARHIVPRDFKSGQH
jgi:alcohol dehydrogenase